MATRNSRVIEIGGFFIIRERNGVTLKASFQLVALLVAPFVYLKGGER